MFFKGLIFRYSFKPGIYRLISLWLCGSCLGWDFLFSDQKMTYLKTFVTFAFAFSHASVTEIIHFTFNLLYIATEVTEGHKFTHVFTGVDLLYKILFF